MLNRRIALIGIIALLPLWGFVPLKAKAEVNLIEEYVYEQEEGQILEPNLEIVDSLYDSWVVERSKPKNPRSVANIAPKGTSTNYCSCVIFAKSLTGYSKPVGNARNWPKNSNVPIVGGVVITSESPIGHTAVITAVRDGEFDVVEANYIRCRKGTRTIKINNPVILGYWQRN